MILQLIRGDITCRQGNTPLFFLVLYVTATDEGCKVWSVCEGPRPWRTWPGSACSTCVCAWWRRRCVRVDVIEVAALKWSAFHGAMRPALENCEKETRLNFRHEPAPRRLGDGHSEFAYFIVFVVATAMRRRQQIRRILNINAFPLLNSK